MKKLVFSVSALLFVVGAFAQEKEIDAALSAFESKNSSAAKTELAKVSGQLDSKTLSPESKAKYYYVAGQLALNEGNSMEAAKNFGELAKFENGSIFSAKNKSTKQTEYFATKEQADAAVTSGDYSKVKEETLSPKYLPNVQESLKSKAEQAIQQGNAAYQAKDLEKAGDKFLEASYLVKAIGGDAGIFKYNAALSYHGGEKYQKAVDVYKELIKEGYTGVSTSWVGKDKASGDEISFNSKADADAQAKLGLVTGVKEVKTESVETDLALNTLKALSLLKQYDSIVDEITKKYPKNTEIQSLAANLYHLSGNDEQFLAKLIENTKTDPTNPTNYFNIGVLYMDQGKDAEAISSFEKAVQIDPKFKSAYTNIAMIKVKPEKDYVEIINANLGNSAKQKQTYKEYTEKRKALYKDALPYLEKAFEADKTDFNNARMLRQAYQTAEMFDKEDEMRAIEKSLEKK